MICDDIGGYNVDDVCQLLFVYYHVLFTDLITVYIYSILQCGPRHDVPGRYETNAGLSKALGFTQTKYNAKILANYGLQFKAKASHSGLKWYFLTGMRHSIVCMSPDFSSGDVKHHRSVYFCFNAVKYVIFNLKIQQSGFFLPQKTHMITVGENHFSLNLGFPEFKPRFQGQSQ